MRVKKEQVLKDQMEYVSDKLSAYYRDHPECDYCDDLEIELAMLEWMLNVPEGDKISSAEIDFKPEPKPKITIQTTKVRKDLFGVPVFNHELTPFNIHHRLDSNPLSPQNPLGNRNRKRAWAKQYYEHKMARHTKQ